MRATGVMEEGVMSAGAVPAETVPAESVSAAPSAAREPAYDASIRTRRPVAPRRSASAAASVPLPRTSGAPNSQLPRPSEKDTPLHLRAEENAATATGCQASPGSGQ